MTIVIVERKFETPETFEELQAQEEKFSWCMDQHNVRFLRTYFSQDRTIMICEYEAPDAESVRQVQRTAGMPYENIWSAKKFDWDAEDGE